MKRFNLYMYGRADSIKNKGLVGNFNTTTECINFLDKSQQDPKAGIKDWHIIDTIKKEMILPSYKELI